MRWEIVLFSLIISVTNGRAQIILTEIMFNPDGNERYDEFVEIYNAGDAETVDLTGWLLSDSSKYNVIQAFQGKAEIKPHQYGLILVPNYFIESRRYDAEIPADALILTIGNAQLGAYGLNNSKGERVSIHRPDTELVTAYKYSPDNADGFSEEKIDLNAGDVTGNWVNSLKKGGTPGRPNSVMPHEHDLELTGVTFSPESPNAADSILFILTIRNAGKSFMDSCAILVEQISPGQNTLGSFSHRLQAPPGDSREFRFVLPPLGDGDFTLRFRISHPLDENPDNNSAEIIVAIHPSYAQGSAVINEVMYNTDEKDQEWVELYNASTELVNLKNWTFADKQRNVRAAENDLILPPDGYVVLANQHQPLWDSSAVVIILKLPELNNSGDQLALRDGSNRLIDTLAYQPSMGGARDRSLERIKSDGASADPQNWGSCEDSSGCTPGKRNSISPSDYDPAIDRTSLRIMPTAPGEGDEVQLTINLYNAGRLAVSDVTLQLLHANFSDSFEIVEDHSISLLAENDTIAISLSWRAEKPGKHLLKICCNCPIDQRLTNNACTDTLFVSFPRRTVVINEIMYSPLPGCCEWVEIYNCGQDSIDLMGWSLSDSDTTICKCLSRTKSMLAPQGFVIIAKDSSFQPTVTTEWIAVSDLPSLANEADEVILYDINQSVHDRVAYSSAWGGARGRSLERIQPDIDSVEPSNWMTCVDAEGNSMGKRNSVFVAVVPKQTALQVQPNPFSPDGDGFDDVTAISYTLPGKSARINVKIYDIKGRLVRFLLNNELSGAQRTVFWDGRSDGGEICRMGIYIVFMEALDESQKCFEACRSTVVLAAPL